MSPTPGRQWEQLPMFMTPHEIGALKSNDDPRKRPVAETAKDMRANTGEYYRTEYAGQYRSHPRAKTPSQYLDAMHQSADERGGIETPITVFHLDGPEHDGGGKYLLDGNHRAVTALETNRLLPVEHISTLPEARAHDFTMWAYKKDML